MNAFLDKLLKLKAIVKAGVVAGILVVAGALYYFMVYADLGDEITAAEARQTQVKAELITYQKRRVEYLAYKAELTQLQEEQRELLKVLPRRAEIPSFLSMIQDQIELSGLEPLTVTIDAEQPEELFVRIPVKMEVRGTYHSITKFFRNTSELRRIVNVENLSLIPERNPSGEVDGATTKIKAKFIAVTFRFQDQPAGAPGGGV